MATIVTMAARLGLTGLQGRVARLRRQLAELAEAREAVAEASRHTVAALRDQAARRLARLEAMSEAQQIEAYRADLIDTAEDSATVGVDGERIEGRADIGGTSYHASIDQWSDTGDTCRQRRALATANRIRRMDADRLAEYARESHALRIDYAVAEVDRTAALPDDHGRVPSAAAKARADSLAAALGEHAETDPEALRSLAAWLTCRASDSAAPQVAATITRLRADLGL